MDRESRRVNPNFYKLVNPDMAFHGHMRDLETVTVLGMHPRAIDQFVAVGQGCGAFFAHA